MTVSRIATGIGIASLLVGAVLIMPAAATGTVRPATALAISLDCQAIGNYSYDCFAGVTGGVAPYTVHWNNGKTGESTVGKCGPNPKHAVVSATVFDSTGASASATSSFDCYGGSPA
jgi:hypothetical protein